MALKIGDRVTIRKDLKEGLYNKGTTTCVPDMTHYSGQKRTILDIYSNGDFLLMDAGGWAFSEDMFEEKKVTNWRRELCS